MKDIVLLSNKPWKHTKYLHWLSEVTGSKVIAFLCSKLRVDPDIFMLNPHSLYVPDRIEMYAENEAYDSVRNDFPHAEVLLIDSFEEVEKFYDRENTVIIIDIEPDNDFSFLFCEFYEGDDFFIEKTFYSAECRVAIEYSIEKFGEERVLIPSGYNKDGSLEYKDYDKQTRLINMVMY